MHDPPPVNETARDNDETLRDNEAWLRDLAAPAPQRAAAIADLRRYLLRVVLVYLLHRRTELARLSFEDVRQLAEDWAQLATLKVLDEMGGFRGDSRFTTWAYRIAINVASADLRRRRWTERSLDEPLPGGSGEDEDRLIAEPRETGPGPEDLLNRSAAWDVIRLAVAEDLTERQRQVLTRVVLDGQPPEAVAAALGTNRNNVYKLLHDARSGLRRAIERRGWRPDDVMASFAGSE